MSLNSIIASANPHTLRKANQGRIYSPKSTN